MIRFPESVSKVNVQVGAFLEPLLPFGEDEASVIFEPVLATRARLQRICCAASASQSLALPSPIFRDFQS